MADLLEHSLLKSTNTQLHSSWVPQVNVGGAIPQDINQLVEDVNSPGTLYITTGVGNVNQYRKASISSVSWGDIQGSIADQTDLTPASIGAQAISARLNQLINLTPTNGYAVGFDGSGNLQTIDLTGIGSGSGDMLQATYDTNADGKVNAADVADVAPWNGLSGRPAVIDELATLPEIANNLIGWDGTGTALANISPSTFAAAVHAHTLDQITDSGALAALDEIGNAQIAPGADIAWSKISSPTRLGQLIALTATNGYAITFGASGQLTTTDLSGLGGGSGDMLRSTYDTNLDGKVNAADVADAAPYGGLTGLPTAISSLGALTAIAGQLLAWDGSGVNIVNVSPATFAPATHTHTLANITDSGALAALDEIGSAQIINGSILGTDIAADTIALSNLAPSVETAVLAGGTALQAGDSIPVADVTGLGALALLNEITNTQISASAGIVSTKLSAAVQTSLGLADNSLQSVDIGVDIQAHDPILDSLSGLLGVANNLIGWNTGGTALVNIDPAVIGGGDMSKATYDTNDDGIVDAAASVLWSGITSKPNSIEKLSLLVLTTNKYLGVNGTGDIIEYAFPLLSELTNDAGFIASINLSYSPSPTGGTVNNPEGNNANLTLADATNAGLLSPGDFTKLSGIESNAEANNISDLNAIDLTDGGETTLHNHDGRYYTETEVNTLLNGKEPTITAGTVSQYLRGDKSFQTLNKASVGLGSVDNTSDAQKPVSIATQNAIDIRLSESDSIQLTDGGDTLLHTHSAIGISNSTSTGRSLLTAISAAAARSILGIDPIPVGTIKYYAVNTPPTGWLKANGAAVSRTTYASLFSAIGITFGGGDGSTTFNLPDLRGEFLRGWDDGRGIDSGRSFGSTQASQNEAHSHRVTNESGAVDATGTGAFALFEPGAVSTWDTESQGGSEARPRNVALLAIIKF